MKKGKEKWQGDEKQRMEGHKERKIERTVKDEKRRQSNERKFKTIKYNWGMKTMKKNKKNKGQCAKSYFCTLSFVFYFFNLTSLS